MKHRYALSLAALLLPTHLRAQEPCLPHQAYVEVLSPDSIAGVFGAGYMSGDGSWADTTGLIPPGVTGRLVHVEDPGVDSIGAKPGEGCAPLTNADDVAGNIAFIRRGACEFGLKALHAQEAGAIGWMIQERHSGSDDDTTVIVMQGGVYGHKVIIPGLFVSMYHKNLLLDAMETDTVTVNMRYAECWVTAIEPSPDGAPGTHALSAISPNPSAGRASFTLEVASTQRIRVAVFEALGREVALLHDGLLPAGLAHRLTFDGSALPAGVYVVRATGEAFDDARRLVLVR